MQESLTTSHNLLHTSVHHVQFYRGFASLHAVRHNLQTAMKKQQNSNNPPTPPHHHTTPTARAALS
ncbi:hypothetical protein [Prevotellamassilia timonensis]|uniref:hypothetical protein n=1 Tax=Prevotellamassilia timonensis TaxID=1852370 RepID=UPI003FED5B52